MLCYVMLCYDVFWYKFYNYLYSRIEEMNMLQLFMTSLLL